MTRRLFLAGASGVVGRRLAPLLLADGWFVTGTTRSTDRAVALARAGIDPVVVDVFDAEKLRAAVVRARPSVVIHQLTDLPPGLDASRLAAAIGPNARIREEGTRNLIAAALAAGAQRMVAQSLAFAYAQGPTPHGEEDPLDVDAPGAAGVTARGVASLERQMREARLEWLVLRYGRFYGTGTGFEKAVAAAPLHIDDAAEAARLAARRGTSGIYNIAEDDGAVSIEKARRELGWTPGGNGRQSIAR
jgi:nucleoside-diphosphate-sugar epimerase